MSEGEWKRVVEISSTLNKWGKGIGIGVERYYGNREGKWKKCEIVKNMKLVRGLIRASKITIKNMCKERGKGCVSEGWKWREGEANWK